VGRCPPPSARTAAVASRKDLLLLLITTLDRLILGLRPCCGARAGGAANHRVSAGFRRLPFALPPLIRGPALHGPPDNGYLSCTARDIRLEMTGGFAILTVSFFPPIRFRGPVRIQGRRRRGFSKGVSMPIPEAMLRLIRSKASQPAADAVKALAERGAGPARRVRAGHCLLRFLPALGDDRAAWWISMRSWTATEAPIGRGCGPLLNRLLPPNVST